MAIQNRRGAYVDFKPNKMVSGEWAIVLSGDPNAVSGQSVYIAFNNSQVKRMATYEDMVENINIATADIQAELRSGVEEAIGDIETAISDAQAAVTTMEGQITLAIADADDRISAIEAEYEDLVIADEARLDDMQYQIDVAVATAANATSAANEAAADALEAAEEAREIIEQGSVASVFGRAGIVVAQAGDYDSTQITHDVGVSVADAISSLETLTDDKVDKSGDVMTGALYFKVNSTTTTPSSNSYGNELMIKDTNGRTFGYLQSMYLTNGQNGVELCGIRTVDGAVKYNAIRLLIGDDGNPVVSFAGTNIKEAWRSAIDAVNKNGDTMTGRLTLQGSQMNILYKSTDIDSDIGKTIPSSNTSLGGFYINDKNGTNNGWIRVYKSTGDNLYWSMIIRRNVSGSILGNELVLGINSSGNRYVSVSDGGIWRSAIGVPPTSHASSATTYGLGTTGNYGHVKTINNLTTSAHADGLALSAYQGYLLQQRNDVKKVSVSVTLPAIGKWSNQSLEYTIPSTTINTSDYNILGIVGYNLNGWQLLPLRMQISGNKIQYRLLNFTTDTDVAAGRVIYFDVLVKHK